jgi:hypothetical protein
VVYHLSKQFGGLEPEWVVGAFEYCGLCVSSIGGCDLYGKHLHGEVCGIRVDESHTLLFIRPCTRARPVFLLSLSMCATWPSWAFVRTAQLTCFR